MLHRNFIKLAFTICLVIMLSACAVPFGSGQEAPATIPPEMMTQIRDGDVITLTVYGEESLTGDFQVDPSGNLNLPLLGQVKAQGKTQESLQDDIKQRLTEGKLFAKPYVTLDIKAPQPIYILGEVNTPGSYPYQAGLDVLKAVALGGGYTPRAYEHEVLITRIVDGQKTKLDGGKETPLLPGDSITVRERIF